MLETFAEARGLDLATAAKQLDPSLAAAGRLLVETEQERDRLLAEIDGVASNRQIKTIEGIIG